MIVIGEVTSVNPETVKAVELLHVVADLSLYWKKASASSWLALQVPFNVLCPEDGAELDPVLATGMPTALARRLIR